MASLAEPGFEGVKELMRRLECAQIVIYYGALRQVRAAFSGVQINHAQFEALVDSYHVGVERIYVLVEIVLRMLTAPSRFSQLDGEVKGLSLLLLSLAEIERCVQSGRCCLLSSSELLDSEAGNGRSSRIRSFLLREFYFSVDLARVAFVIIMLQAKIHLDKSWGSRSQSRSDVAEEFCNRPAHELFEWCERKRRPVLKQRTLNFGEEITQCILLNEPAALLGLADLPRTERCNPWGLWSADPDAVSEESSAEWSDSLPLKIDFKDVHDQVLLGRGSFGGVFRCNWLGQSVAMKTMQLDKKEPELEPELERRFGMEVSTTASLQHPNAVSVFGFGYTEGRAKGFILMEHMQTDLDNVIRERRDRRGESHVFPLDVALDIMSQVVEGMCGLRRAGVVHRDLKPANILVNRRDESMGPSEGFYDVKISDFGSSKVQYRLESVFRTLRKGTPAYMAPEVMSPTLLPERNGEYGYSWKADVYSFAMVCAEILSGERPFQHLIGVTKILAAVRGGDRPELRLGGGDPLRRLIEDCWKFNAEERPDFMEVRRRLWECRVYHFFRAEEVPTSWQTFGTRLDARW